MDKRVETEPDLEKKVEILQEARDRFPDEAHFQGALRLVRERLDLVTAIVAKARHYEDQGQFNEALGQWDILRTIHGGYPGLAYEMERVTKRREQQSAMDTHARWVKEIDQCLQVGDYARARSLCQSGLGEFPGDSEMTELEKLARQSEERCAEAQQLLGRGEEKFESGSFEEGLDIVRAAHQLDARSPIIRAVLLERLVTRARGLMDSDWKGAEALVREALDLHSGHAGARSLQMLLEDKKREEFLNQAVAGARQSQANEDVNGAVRQIEAALSRYPSDPRLLQVQAALRAEQKELERAKTRRSEPAQAVKLAEPAPPLPSAQPEPPREPVAAKVEPSVTRAASAFGRWTILAAAVVLVVIAAAAAWLFFQRREPATTPATPVAGAPIPAAKAEPESPPPAKDIPGTLRIEVSPPSAVLSYRGADEKVSRPFGLPSMQLPPGRYVITARSPGYEEAVRPVVLEPAGTQSLVFDLAAAKPREPDAKVRSMDAKDWDKPWTHEGDWYLRQGGGFTLYSAAPSTGTYQFTIRPKDAWSPLSNPKVRWVADYLDPRNYVLFELNDKNYTCTEYREGKPIVRVAKRPHGVQGNFYSIRFYVERARLVVMLMAGNQQYKAVDAWNEPGRDFGAGRFGFYSPGSDQI